ncbi:MAG: hypothetical protein R2909_02790 [Gemmatimonadales bacterium]
MSLRPDVWLGELDHPSTKVGAVPLPSGVREEVLTILDQLAEGDPSAAMRFAAGRVAQALRSRRR